MSGGLVAICGCTCSVLGLSAQREMPLLLSCHAAAHRTLRPTALPLLLSPHSLRSTILAGHANEDPHFRVDCEDFGERLQRKAYSMRALRMPVVSCIGVMGALHAQLGHIHLPRTRHGGMPVLLPAIHPHPHHTLPSRAPDGNINTADPEWESPCLGDLEVVYLPWDVLFLDGRCVCHLPVLERRELLRRALREAPPEGGRACGRMGGHVACMWHGMAWRGTGVARYGMGVAWHGMGVAWLAWCCMHAPACCGVNACPRSPSPSTGYPLSPNGVLRGRVVPMLPGQPLLGTVAAPCLCRWSGFGSLVPSSLVFMRVGMR